MNSEKLFPVQLKYMTGALFNDGKPHIVAHGGETFTVTRESNYYSIASGCYWSGLKPAKNLRQVARIIRDATKPAPPAPIFPGDVLTCAETGKQFIAANEGCSVNYAHDREGNIYSNEGVDIRERRGLLDRSRPFFCYVSSDCKRVTGWKGNKLGDIVATGRGGGFGGRMLHVRVRDVHGGMWRGQGAGEGMCITLRAIKGAGK